jgi:hypothetical protein
MPEAAYRALLVEIAKTAIENHKKGREVREAIAQVVQYEPRLRPFYTDAQAVTDDPEVIISLLMDAETGCFGRDADNGSPTRPCRASAETRKTRGVLGWPVAAKAASVRTGDGTADPPLVDQGTGRPGGGGIPCRAWSWPACGRTGA